MDKKIIQRKNFYDRSFYFVFFSLVIVGLTMVISSSIPISLKLTKDPLFFAKNHFVYIILSFFAFFFVLNVPIKYWEKYHFLLLIFSVILLILSLFLGHSVNGSSRWLNIKIIKIQPSEIVKLSLFSYISGYLVRKNNKLKTNFFDLLKPIFILILIVIFLFFQPDLGTIIILILTTFSLLFIAGAKIFSLLIIIVFFGISSVGVLYFKTYFVRRMISFFDPWSDPFGIGYQLTQSLMAFGRGSLFGVGLGNSIQKLEYLPEAHTDFIYSILAEELGYFGSICVLFMLFFIVFRAIKIGKKELEFQCCFSGYFACSIGIWIGYQTIINVGGSIGILPTKGLTLPLISYGGSSLFVTFISIAILLRIDFETRINKKINFLRILNYD